MTVSRVWEYYILSRKDSMKIADNISTVVEQTLITLWVYVVVYNVYCLLYTVYSIYSRYGVLVPHIKVFPDF